MLYVNRTITLGNSTMHEIKLSFIWFMKKFSIKKKIVTNQIYVQSISMNTSIWLLETRKKIKERKNEINNVEKTLTSLQLK